MANQNAEGISGVAIAVVFTGALLAWSGVKGYKLSFVAQDLIAGKDPSQDTRVQSSALTVSPGGLFTDILKVFNPFGALTGTSSNGSSSGGSVGSANVQSGSSGRFGTAFAKSLLATIGVPQTSANIASIQAWARAEGGGGSNNPLNTTWGSPQSGTGALPGATVFNSVGVMNYASFAQGVMANALALKQHYYTDIVAALKTGNGLCGQHFSGLSTWSGGGYSSVC